MQLLTFRGKSMAEALTAVKRQLGPDALIVHTRTFKVGGVLGVGAKEEVEILLQDNGVTRIGSRNLFMIGVHVGHDCIIEDNCVLSNSTALAGHVYIQRNAILSGHVGVHQFTTIGAYVHVAALTRISQDAVPYMRIEGIPGKVRGVNDVGLKRAKFSDSVVKEIREAYRTIYLRENTTSQAIDMLDGPGVIPEVTNIINFIRSSARGTSGRARESLRRAH
jgi:UDP-N-acetylglucosamine acyltransferase